MAMGQPVVAFDSKVHREYLGEHGVYVPKGDVEALAAAIGSLLQHEERRCRLGAALRQRAATNFSWAAAGARIDALYHELLADPEIRPG